MPAVSRHALRNALLSLCLLAGLLAVPHTARAQACGEGEPGRAEWTHEEEGKGLYHAVFTGRHATLTCFELLDPQYEKREETSVPTGVPGWLGLTGPLNLVTTWDAEYLPYALTFLQLKGDRPITRTLEQPTKSAPADWKAGETRTAPPSELFAHDPVFALVSASDDEIVYVWPDPARDESSLFIEKRYRKLGGYRLMLYVTLYNFGQGDLVNQPQLTIHSWEAERAKQGLFSPAPNVLEGMCMVGDDDLEKEDSSSLQEEALNPAGNSRWAGLATRYFLKAVVPRGLSEARCSLTAGANGVVSAAIYRPNPFSVSPAEGATCFPAWYQPDADLLRCADVAAKLELQPHELRLPALHQKAYEQHKGALGEAGEDVLSVLKNLASSRGSVLYSFEFYLGPKDIDRLKEAEVGLEDSIDFWIVGFIAKPMLYLLRWFHSFIPSWAVAIIILTILVKLLLLPWTQKSFTQMQRMSQLKPMMEELKQKYGKDKERLNQEMMNLYKREKVNPLGGCLPMLLQMPIWIALYRTIYSSVELYQAPLGFWIQDLSAPDPYFVLPLLLGAAMFGQQKLSPTTMDSAQAKMMLYMMPIMFTVFMLFLPAGLNLYILVNTFLTMGQQFYLRKKFNVQHPKAAKA